VAVVQPVPAVLVHLVERRHGAGLGVDRQARGGRSARGSRCGTAGGARPPPPRAGRRRATGRGWR
jgi:hypothetical protein